MLEKSKLKATTQLAQIQKGIVSEFGDFFTPTYIKKVSEVFLDLFKYFSQKLYDTIVSISNANDNLKLSTSFNFFLSGNEESESQELFFGGDESQEKPLEVFLKQISPKELPKQARLELKMEKIKDMKGIEDMKSLRFLSLSMNKISDLNNIAGLKNLVEINLA